MITTKGLMIPIHILEIASGISNQQIKQDIANSTIRIQFDGYIWYRDALVYVFNKWKEGKIEMYPPYSEDPDQSFAARVLSLMDDEITVHNLKVEWNEKT